MLMHTLMTFLELLAADHSRLRSAAFPLPKFMFKHRFHFQSFAEESSWLLLL